MNQIDPEVLAACAADKEFTINGRTYSLLKIPHRNSLRIIGYVQKIESGAIVIGDPGWMELESALSKHFTFDGSILTKIPEHFEEYPQDYMTFIAYAVGVITFPFIGGNVTS